MPPCLLRVLRVTIPTRRKRLVETTTKASRWAMAGITLLFVVLAGAASIINPPHEATDELRHYRFVRYVAEEWALPVQGGSACNAQAHHPPLYYALAALASGWIETGQGVCYEPPQNPFWAYRYWEVGNDNKNQYLHYTDSEGFPWSGGTLAALMARWVNVLIGAATVWLTYWIGLAIWGKRPFLAIAGTAFLAFNPMFVYMAGAVNNDVIAAFAGAAVTLAAVRLVQDERGLSLRWGLMFGALYSLALLSKFNLAAIAPTIGLAMTYVAWRKRQWGLWLKAGLVIIGVTGLLAGWWFGRNQLLYGEPTGVQRLTELWGVRDPSESFWLAVHELSYAWTSLWGRFGYGQIPLPEGIYAGLRWVLVATVVGYGLLLIRYFQRKGAESAKGGNGEVTAVSLLLLLFNVLLFFGVLFNYLLISPAGPMGRFFFPALPSLSILMAFGLSQYLAGWKSARRDQLLAGALNGGMALLTIVALWGYLRPAYAPPPRWGEETTVSNPSNAQFDNLVTLRGYQIQQSEVRPGEPIDLDLYWEVLAQPPGDYLLFVHLVDDNGLMVAQRDTHPGLGNFPTRNWRPGDRFVESIRLYAPDTAYTPNQASLSIGLYAPGSFRLGVSDADGQELGDSLKLGEVALLPLPDAYPNATTHNFNNQLLLRGYEYNKRLFDDGDVLAVTFYWETLADPPADLEFRLSVLDETGKEIIFRQGKPEPATAEWAAGSVVEDTFLLDLGYTLSSEAYQVRLIVIEAVSQKVQDIVAEDGRLLNDHLMLSRIRMD
jgi:4-amino-4-deoxy-L-arabinose transferase-like glycosyltransferase